MDGTPETFVQKLTRKFKAEPLVPIGALATVACLVGGLRAFQHGNAVTAQSLMRGRVLAQAFTVLVMTAGASMGLKPASRPVNM